MCNYFSFGADCKVGYKVEQNRTESRFCNYCNYAWCGLKQMFCGCCCKETNEVYSIDELVDYVAIK